MLVSFLQESINRCAWPHVSIRYIKLVGILFFFHGDFYSSVQIASSTIAIMDIDSKLITRNQKDRCKHAHSSIPSSLIP